MTSSEIKDLYLRSIEKIQIEFTAMQQNNSSTHSQLHRLSGSCANLGFVHLSQTLQAIKTCLSNDKSSQKLIASLLPLLDKSKNEVIDFIDNNAKS
jgi:HPt (histidine-containing phosphotransfer) domain-containing protein